MKRLIALILVCALCALCTAAFAAEWAEGLSPAKPSNLKAEVDLTKSVGYWLPYPRAGLTASRFCDVLELYMPNPDIALGEGTATLWKADGAVATMDFTDPDQVELRELEESELEKMHWGCGICVEIHLPISLKYDEKYYVTMDEGTLTSNGGAVKSLAIPYSDKVSLEEQYWTPILSGDFGISGLFYSEPAEAPEEPEEIEEVEEEEVEEAVEVTEEMLNQLPDVVEEEVEEEPEEEEDPGEPKYNPVKGDRIHFDLVLGGDATSAVLYSENNSVFFKQPEYTESGAVSGTITGDDMFWGVVFLNDNGEVLDYVTFGNYERAEVAEDSEAEATEETEIAE